MASTNMTARIIFVGTPEMKKKVQIEAKKQDVNVPEYLRQALDFYSTFNVHFLEQMKITADRLHLPIPIVIQNLLTAFMSTETAALEAYGTKPTIFQRAFQYDDKGLIVGDKLSHLTFDQATVDLEKLKVKLEESARTGKAATITLEEGAFLASHRQTATAAI